MSSAWNGAWPGANVTQVQRWPTITAAILTLRDGNEAGHHSLATLWEIHKELFHFRGGIIIHIEVMIRKVDDKYFSAGLTISSNRNILTWQAPM